MKKVLMLITVGILSTSLWADKVNDENGVVVQRNKLQYAGQSNLMCTSGVKFRKPASIDKTNKFLRFFDSKEDRFKNLYFDNN